MNPVVHFEMPVKDRERVKEFYSQVFGWQMNQMGEEMGHYVIAITTDSDENGPKKPGAINGGFYMPESGDHECPSFVISVENVDEYAEKIKTAGGEILDGPMDIPGVGNYIAFRDTEGNRVGALQPTPMN